MLNEVFPAMTTAQKLEARKICVWCRRDARFFATSFFRDRAISHPRSPPGGLARLGSTRLGSASPPPHSSPHPTHHPTPPHPAPPHPAPPTPPHPTPPRLTPPHRTPPHPTQPSPAQPSPPHPTPPHATIFWVRFLNIKKNMLVRGLVVNYVWSRRDAFFSKRSICRRRDDTRFFECAFGVDETLVGKCSFLERCVLRRRDVILQNAFAIVAQKSPSSMAPDGATRFPNMCLVWARCHFLKKTSIRCKRDDILLFRMSILDGARWRDPLPKVGAWCRRDVIFSKKVAFGVDETTLDFENVHLV